MARKIEITKEELERLRKDGAVTVVVPRMLPGGEFVAEIVVKA